ncbi:hypothetical protein CLOM_g5784 [Closterium sp. NIES-68]|nr:hypothetical protein CLOM_g5784 [Closterium sp. NIES-68]GJP73836.1 hypothetical protein CLOP_g4515 [Closterium sp. NIES-67]
MFACAAAAPSVPSSLRVADSARSARSHAPCNAPTLKHWSCSSARAAIYPRFKLSDRENGMGASQLGSNRSACFQGASRISCQAHAQAAERRNSQKRPPRLSTHASIDAFVIAVEDTLLNPSSQHLLPPAAEALKSTSLPFYLLTSSSSSVSPADVSMFLKRDAGVDIPEDSPRIMMAGRGGGGEGKLAALLSVNSRPLAQDPANTMHYIDADLTALNRAASQPELARWQLYHAQWSEGAGSNEGTRDPRIKPIVLKDFDELLRWGLLMGVNDGCQEYEDGTPAT